MLEIIKEDKEMKKYNFTMSRDALDETKLSKDNAIAIKHLTLIIYSLQSIHVFLV